MKSLDFVTLRVKDAIADHFRSATGRRPSVDAREPDLRVHVFLDEKMCTLYVDTSGESLFKRGRRDHVGEAPLKKNLAAGILRIARWRPGTALLDPMCGAGTFLSEAAEMSLGWAAGRARGFGFEKLARFNAQTGTACSPTRKKGEKPGSTLRSTARPLRALAGARGDEPARGGARGGGAVEAGESPRAERAGPARRHRHQSALRRALGEKEKLEQFYPQLGAR